MSTLTNTSRDNAGSLLGWLSFRGSKSQGKSGTKAKSNGATIRQTAMETRSWLLEAISSFLLENELEVSSANLQTAHSAFSGMNPRLARQISAKMQAGDKITQKWLDEAIGKDEPETTGEEEIAKLISKLEGQLDTFAKSTNDARSATTSYNAELEQHVAELEEIEETSQILTNLAGLTRAMLEHTRKVEEDMRRSEGEAKELRRNLERARRDAEIDHLTGLPNRRAFEALLNTNYREAQAAIEPLSVAFCDIDHFKRINDTHGHDAGDRVIKVIAESLGKIANSNCHVARHGGEEFVMLFRGIPLSEAKERLNAVREDLADRRLINRKSDKPFGQITFSGGVADVFAYGDPRAALRAADEALYVAKENGRNQILVADASLDEVQSAA